MNTRQMKVLTILNAIERITDDVAGLKETGQPFNYSVDRIGIQAKAIERAVDWLKDERRETAPLAESNRYFEDADGMLWAK